MAGLKCFRTELSGTENFWTEHFGTEMSWDWSVWDWIVVGLKCLGLNCLGLNCRDWIGRDWAVPESFLRLRESVTFLNFCSFLCKKGDTWCMMSWICHGGIFPLIFRWIWLMSTFIKIWRNWEFLRWPPLFCTALNIKWEIWTIAGSTV